MLARTKTEEDLAAEKHIVVFGKNLSEIVCFRKTFICGICCGFAGGLLCFLATSKVVFSTHFAFGSLWAGVFGYWFPCRYRYETLQLQYAALKEMHKERIK